MDFYLPIEAAQIIGVSQRTLIRWDISGKLKARRTTISHYPYYTEEDIQKAKKIKR